jgi:hypothetical protein
MGCFNYQLSLFFMYLALKNFMTRQISNAFMPMVQIENCYCFVVLVGFFGFGGDHTARYVLKGQIEDNYKKIEFK